MIFDDLAKLYAADRVGLPATLPPAASFRDFVADQQSAAVIAEMDAALEFWAAQYASGVPVFELPLDRTRPVFKTYTAGRQVLAIDKALFQAAALAGFRQRDPPHRRTPRHLPELGRTPGHVARRSPASVRPRPAAR